MAPSSIPLVVLLWVSSVYFLRGFAALPICPRSDLALVDSLRLQCPRWIERSPPIEVSGDTLDKELGRSQGTIYYSVLFYASWCPFSRNIQPTFDALSSMFPQMTHLAVEESFAMPSVFSRYGIHSFPAVLIANRTAMVRYRGSKDLRSLVHFYKETTGLEPVAYFDVDQPSSLGNSSPLWRRNGYPREIVEKEPYIAFSLLFIFVKTFLHFFPKIVSRLRAFWLSYTWHLNFGIIGESSQLLERILHVIDFKKLWNKLRLCNKTRNFQTGAKNARVWATSLASVSLGEASSRDQLYALQD